MNNPKDIPSLIIGMECAALDRWIHGDPSGFLEVCAEDVVYFYPYRERRVDGLEALTALYRELWGKVQLDRFELLNPCWHRLRRLLNSLISGGPPEYPQAESGLTKVGTDISETDIIRCETSKDLCRSTLNRPDVLNAINRGVLGRLSLILDDIKSSSAVQAVIITGAGEKSFSVGTDIGFLNQASPLEVREFARAAVAVYHKIETLGRITVAAINGYALGGGL